MSKCRICQRDSVRPILDFGAQALANRFLQSPSEHEALFSLVIGQCSHCQLLQLIHPAPADELRARVDWITYNEQEGHLDDLVEKILLLPGVTTESQIGAISFKDDTTVERFRKKGFAKTWRLDPQGDLGIV